MTDLKDEPPAPLYLRWGLVPETRKSPTIGHYQMRSSDIKHILELEGQPITRPLT